VTAEEFTNFGTTLGKRLKRSGYDDIQAVLHGSAVTGVRATSKLKLGIPAGTPFDAMKMSDFDVALVSPKLLAKAKEIGIPTRGSAKMRTGELWPGNLHSLGIGDVRDVLSKTLYYHDGRKINFMIFGSLEEALSRGPSIRIPGT
jgi:filamentous hemagglutinin